MPLIKSSSKKAFKKNVETEMDANPSPEDRKQNLAIAFATQRKAKKKMARGGIVEGENDKGEISRNSGKKELKEDGWLDKPTEKQAASASPAKMRKQDDHNWDNEGEAKIDDASTSEDEEMLEGKRPSKEQFGNSFGRPSIDDAHDDRDLDMYAKGGEIHPSDLMDDDERADSIADAIMKRRAKKKMMAEGGRVESGIDDNNQEQPNSYYKQNESASDASLKENYNDDFLDEYQPMDSNLHGDDREKSEEDDLDMISKIRSKIKAKKGM